MFYKNIVYIVLTAVTIGGCINPFAPKLDLALGSEDSQIGDISSINGVFKNFQYAYSFKDTTIYGALLSDDFIFAYRDYDLGADVSWSRNEEMRVTHGLFQNSDNLDLVWNNIVTITADSSNIVRSFNLTVTFNPTDIIFIDGRVNLDLKKTNDNIWQITRWTDESNF